MSCHTPTFPQAKAQIRQLMMWKGCHGPAESQSYRDLKGQVTQVFLEQVRRCAGGLEIPLLSELTVD
jgi:hypothetical protein